MQQAKFNGKFLQAFRGIADNVFFDDDERLETFLSLSEEKKQECEWTYNPLQNDLTETLSVVWNVDTKNFIGQYTGDFLRFPYWEKVGKFPIFGNLKGEKILFGENIGIFFPNVGINMGKKLVVYLDWDFYVNFPKLGKIMEHKNIP